MKNKKLPEGWKEVELGNIFTFEKKSNIKAGEGQKIGKYKFFTSSDIQSKFIDEAVLDGEYLIFSTGGSAGIHYCNGKFSTSTDCFVVQVNTDLIAKYVYYYILTNIHILEAGFKGAGLKHISKEYIKRINMVFPQKKEIQQKIVSILEKAEQAKEMRKKADELTKDFLKAVFIEMFGDPQRNNKRWNLTIINDCVDITQYGASAKSNTKNKGYPIFGMNCISENGEIDLSKHNFVDISREEYLKLKLDKGDVIFNRTNSPDLVGKTTVWNYNMDAVIASYLVKLKLKSNCNPIFFTFLMNTSYFKEIFYINSKKAVNQANISPTLLKTFQMYLPPIELQNKFASIVKEVEAMKEQQKHSKEQMDNLFNALMQKAFKGELV